MQQTYIRFQAKKAVMRNLETQVGQIANMIAERNQGKLPSNTKKNPREHVKAIHLRSVKKLSKREKQQEKVKDE